MEHLNSSVSVKMKTFRAHGLEEQILLKKVSFKELTAMKTSGPDSLAGTFFQLFKEEITASLT